MNQTLKHSLLITHRWLGWIFGFTNLVICITGGFYVFRTELTGLLVEMEYETTKLDAIFHFIIEGHQYLWLSPNIGKWIVGISVIAFLITAITGIIICIPYYTNNKLLFKWHKKKTFRLLIDYHILFGTYFIIPITLLCVTGLVYIFEFINDRNIMCIIDMIHRGQFCGIIGQILTLITSVVGASLSITGYYITLKRYSKNK